STGSAGTGMSAGSAAGGTVAAAPVSVTPVSVAPVSVVAVSSLVVAAPRSSGSGTSAIVRRGSSRGTAASSPTPGWPSSGRSPAGRSGAVSVPPGATAQPAQVWYPPRSGFDSDSTVGRCASDRLIRRLRAISSPEMTPIAATTTTASTTQNHTFDTRHPHLAYSSCPATVPRSGTLVLTHAL